MANTIPFGGSQNNSQSAPTTIPFGGLQSSVQPPPQAPQQSFSDKLWAGIAGAGNAIGSVFPGQKIGNAVGTAAFDAGQMAQGKNPFTNPAKLAGGVPAGGVNPASQANIPQEIGDIAQGTATVGGFGATPSTILGAAGVGAAAGGISSLGGSLANSNSTLDNSSLTKAATSGALGALAGGAIAGGVAGAGQLLSKLPDRLVKSALPKLNDSNIQNVLKNTRVGSIDTLLKDSNTKVASMGNDIHNILSGGQYVTEVGNAGHSIQNTVSAFPQSEYTPNDVVSAVKSVVPGFAKTMTAIQDGTATLAEKNTLRSAIDTATKKVFTDSPQVSGVKTLAAAFASELRQEVQSAAPETQPIFSNLSKELNLRGALQSTAKKLSTKSPVNLYSILSFLSGGLPAALGEEFARSPGTSIAAGKAISKVAPVAQKIAAPLGTLAGGLTAQGGNQANQ